MHQIHYDRFCFSNVPSSRTVGIFFRTCGALQVWLLQVSFLLLWFPAEGVPVCRVPANAGAPYMLLYVLLKKVISCNQMPCLPAPQGAGRQGVLCCCVLFLLWLLDAFAGIDKCFAES